MQTRSGWRRWKVWLCSKVRLLRNALWGTLWSQKYPEGRTRTTSTGVCTETNTDTDNTSDLLQLTTIEVTEDSVTEIIKLRMIRVWVTLVWILEIVWLSDSESECWPVTVSVSESRLVVFINQSNQASRHRDSENYLETQLLNSPRCPAMSPKYQPQPFYNGWSLNYRVSDCIHHPKAKVTGEGRLVYPTRLSTWMSFMIGSPFLVKNKFRLYLKSAITNII